MILTEKGKCFGGFFIFRDYRKSIKAGGGARNEVAPVVLPEVQSIDFQCVFLWCKVQLYI